MGLMFGPLDNWIDNETLFVPDNDEVWNYDDTPWFSATVSNNAPDATVETSGSVKHAALVFAVQLPRQVTFYDQNILTGSYRDSSANTAAGGSATYIADYEGDDYAFYVERTWIDRHTGQTRHAQYTPKQLIEDGWTVKITAQPNYSAKPVYGAAGTDAAHYGKPDTDQPDDTLASRGIENIKPYEHEAETVVFEIAPPDDATDEEFLGYNTLFDAYYAACTPTAIWLRRLHHAEGAHAHRQLGFLERARGQLVRRRRRPGELQGSDEHHQHVDQRLDQRLPHRP